jgi:hypothetical protein
VHFHQGCICEKALLVNVWTLKLTLWVEESIGTVTRGAGKEDAEEQNRRVKWKGSVLTFPSHVQKVPVSSIVFPRMTASIFSTLSCGVRSPSIGKSASVFVMSLYLTYESAI